jgi:hypothetical protein
MSKLQMKLTLLVGLTAIALTSVAKASTWSQKTLFTFSAPVEIPGQILPAGTYVFKLANSNSNRHIVQVFNEDQDRIFGTFLAIPDYRLHPAEKPIISFDERPAGSPPAIKAWVYPGHNYGHEFVYPKAKAVELAKANNTPVPAMPVALTSDTGSVKLDSPEVTALNSAPLKAEEPSGDEVDLASAFIIAYNHTLTPHHELPSKLPETASEMPLIGLAGLVFMGIAIPLRSRAAKAK